MGPQCQKNWTSSRQLQQSPTPKGETEETAEFPYMTFSFVQCDTKGQSWLRSLLLPSVHLDAEKGQRCGDYMIRKRALVTGICILNSGLYNYLFLLLFICVFD